MKNIGYLLITIGFLSGAYLTVLDSRLVQWLPFVITLILGFAGVALVRIGGRQHSHHEDKLAANIAVIEKSLTNLVEKTTRLNEQKNAINTYDMRHRIDEELLEDLDAFAEARETISHVYGLRAYADIMSHFAGGERYLNRVWSASADGYIDEVNEYIQRARDLFVDARRILKEQQAG